MDAIEKFFIMIKMSGLTDKLYWHKKMGPIIWSNDPVLKPVVEACGGRSNYVEASAIIRYTFASQKALQLDYDLYPEWLDFAQSAVDELLTKIPELLPEKIR